MARAQSSMLNRLSAQTDQLVPGGKGLSLHRDVFRTNETHNFPLRMPGTESCTSEELGWKTVHATFRRGVPYEASYTPIKHMCVTLFFKPADIEYQIGGRRARRFVQAGTHILLPAGVSFRERLFCLADSLHLHLRDSLVEETATDLLLGNAEALEILPAIGLDDPLMARIATVFHSALTKQAPLCVLQVDHLAAILATHIIQNHAASSVPNRRLSRAALAKRQVHAIHEYIDANLQSAIRLEVLAHIAGCSRAHFIRRFKASTDMTPYQYVMRARVDRAKNLLTQSDSNIAAIAVDCGFSSQEHMTRVFGNLTGETPAAFRKTKNGISF